ncbi:hypothetical protein EJB05_01437 [Eragrostis curvula]|uniref:Uncharacterized protein n=1 Tax=Eragrostis curvula TaxID=38414 RepID=A0A5J9WRV8_9POAL|nr:hypothetical protein EJB05_01437 [Eragrostis curvula]
MVPIPLGPSFQQHYPAPNQIASITTYDPSAVKMGQEVTRSEGGCTSTQNTSFPEWPDVVSGMSTNNGGVGPRRQTEHHGGQRQGPPLLVDVDDNASCLDAVRTSERHGQGIEEDFVGEDVVEQEQALGVAMMRVQVGIWETDPDTGAGAHVDEALRLAVAAEVLSGEQQPVPWEEPGLQEAGVGSAAPPELADHPETDVLCDVISEKMVGDLGDQLGDEPCPVSLLQAE